MKIHNMRIEMEASNGWTPVWIRYRSPDGETVEGLRVRIGWFFIRIGSKVLYGKRWEAH